MQSGQRLLVVGEQVGGRREHRGRVVGAVPAERGDLVVLPEHVSGGHPLRALMGHPELVQVGRAEPVLDGAHEQVAQLVSKPAGRQGVGDGGRPGGAWNVARRVPSEQVAQDDVLLGPVEQARRRVAPQSRLDAQHAEAEGLPGARQRLGRRTVEPCRDPLPQRSSRRPARGEHQTRVSPGARSHRRDDGLDGQHRRARTRPPEHPQHSRRGVERPLLRRVESYRIGHEGGRATKDDHARIPSQGTDEAHRLPGCGTGHGSRHLVTAPVSVGHQLDLEALPALEVGGVVVWPTRVRMPVGEHQRPAALGALAGQRVNV